MVLPEEGEVLWHLLSGLPDTEVGSRQRGESTVAWNPEEWNTLAFGLLGGVDIGQHTNLLRDRPVRIQVQTHRASFPLFCQTLQLGFEEYALNNQWEEADLLPLLEITENAFLLNRSGVWKLSISEDGETWWATSRLGKSWNSKAFSPKRGDRLWLIEDLNASSIQEVIHLVLSEQCAHFINSTGVESHVQNWVNHIRRPSLRKSWDSVLSDEADYYWAAVQLYNEIHVDSDVAFRERYIQFLVQCADYLHCPDLKSMALDFRRSQRYWKQLGSVLIDDGSPSLRDIPNVHWIDSVTVFKNAKVFVAEDFDRNIEARLGLMESAVQRIVASEKNFFVMVSEILAGLALGRTLVQSVV
jgi:hypothetical protein